MKCYRLCPEKFLAQPLSGIGVAIAGQRWNPKGIYVAYASESPTMALVEAMVHINTGTFPLGYAMLETDVPDDSIMDLKGTLPAGWNELPYSPQAQAIGAKFSRDGKAIALRVPSAIMTIEKNVLLNPHHPRFSEVTWVDCSDKVDLNRLAARLIRVN